MAAADPEPQVVQSIRDFSAIYDSSEGFVEVRATKKKRKKPETTVEEESICIIVRADKKPIPFNFYNKCKSNWPILSLLNVSTLSRNSKGTIIKANILESSEQDFGTSDKTFKLDDIEYEAFSPRKSSPYHGEITFDLNDMEDKNILCLDDEELKEMLHTPSNHNKILSINRLYPRQRIQSEEDMKTFTSMRLSIEFSARIPDRVFFDYVSIPIIPFIQPPKRCFICQRYGHSSLSCRRKTSCTNCAQNHFHTECTVTEKEQFKCSSCDQNHKASSSMCNYYKEALKVAAQLQVSRISQSQAAIEYAKIYKGDNSLKSAPKNLITPSPYEIPSQIFQRNSTQTSIPSGSGTRSKASLPSKGTQQNAPSQFPTPQHSTSLWSITAAQRSRTKKNEEDEEEEDGPRRRRPRRSKSTPRLALHKTKTYAGILDGTRWFNAPSSSEAEIDLDLPTPTPQTRNSLVNQSPPQDVNNRVESEEEEQPQDIFASFKQLLNQLAKWVLKKITSFLGNSPINNIVQNLFTTLISGF